jgi:formylglycine-generating enzyme required for sulfatase activity
MIRLSHILARGAAAVIVGLGVAAGCAPAKRDQQPLSIEETVVVEMENGERIAVGTTEVTWQDWKRCHDAGACGFLPKPAIHDATESFPVVGVNRLDIGEFIAWANAGGERRYRLPTAAEWEAFAAALPKPESSKLFDDPRLAWAADYGRMQSIRREVRPSGDYGSLPNGIQDLGGSVFEWTSTCAVGEADDERCPAYIVQGLHKAVISVFIRDPAVGGCSSGAPPPHIGFRLVSEIEPLQS